MNQRLNDPSPEGHPLSVDAPTDDRLIAYLHCFNVTHDYLECHEFGESLWLDSGRPIVLKGLIQAAVCLYHLENGNVKGGWRMWQRARTYLAPSLPVYEGIDLAQLAHDIDDVFARVPRAWYDQVLSPSKISALGLPSVTIRIVSPKVEEAVLRWHP